MTEIPAGSITFLFTDIEGSTRLWEEHPEAMSQALAQHDTLLRSFIESHNGHVFKTVGDAFCAAFADPSDAVSAALAAQQWIGAAASGVRESGGTGVMEYGSIGVVGAPARPETITPSLHYSTTPSPHHPTIPFLKVRMAIHTGPAELRDGDYFGPSLNRAARLLSAGHGGQVLLSGTAKEALGSAMPAESSLADRGSHRLKDLQQPEQVYQLLHPGLPSDFPPLRSLSTHPNNLPQQVNSFIGREREMAEVRCLMARGPADGGSRLLTLTGSGGCGKTRLALQVVADRLEEYPDGVWLVELAPLTDEGLVPQAVAATLGVREEPGVPLERTLAIHVQSKRLLLLLDNCEHLLNGVALLVETLLRAGTDLRVLATSREPLNIAGEQTYRVPSLAVPGPESSRNLSALAEYEAVRLFVDRASLAHAGFLLSKENARAVAQVARRLDGIPLAIELAAARVRAMPVERIADRLNDGFRILTGGSRTALPRQQTLRATIEWSYNLLSEPERLLMQRIGVFAGGFTLTGAEQVTSGEGVEDWEVLDLLQQLVDKSLVAYDDGILTGADPRFRLLESVRMYCRERLEDVGETEQFYSRHLAYFLQLGEEAECHLTGAGQQEWLDRLDAEHENLRTALDNVRLRDVGWVESRPSGIHPLEAGLRLCGALWRFWYTRGYLAEGRQRLGKALASADHFRPGAERAKALNGAGVLALEQDDYVVAQAFLEESLAIRRELGVPQDVASSLNNIGILARERGDYVSARAVLEEGLAIFRELGDRWGITISLNNLGNAALEQRDYAAAHALYEESLAIGLERDDQRGIALALGNRGIVARVQGDYAQALDLTTKSLELYRELRDCSNIGSAMGHIGLLATYESDFERAYSALEESLSIFRELGDRKGTAESLEGFAGLAHAEGNSARAARLWASSVALRELIGSPLPIYEREQFERQLGAAREALGEDEFVSAWAAGWAMTPEQAVEYALEAKDG